MNRDSLITQDKKYFYRRKLPHLQPPGGTFFVTYRLAGSLPMTVISKLREKYLDLKDPGANPTDNQKEILRQEYFEAFELEMERTLNEPHWLKNDEVARLVMDSLLFNDDKHYTLWGSTLMSNHAHILLSLLENSPLLNVVMQNHKKFTAVHGNKILGRSGQFWAEESFDTLIRNNDHFWRVVRYIINNPVKAGLVENWSDWKWTYLHPELRKDLLLLTE